MSKDPRMSLQTLQVLGIFLSDVDKEHYGLEICNITEIKYGTVQPILRRLEDAGWLESDWEDIDPVKEGRRARRYYKITGEGVRKANNAVQEWQRKTAAFMPVPTGVTVLC